MRLPWQRDTVREAERAAQVEWARVAEATAAQVRQQLAQEDAGWTSLTDLGSQRGELSNAELATIRLQCRALHRVDPTTIRAEKLLASGTFGTGLSAPSASDERVQDVLTAHWDDEDNQLALYSHEALQRSNALMMTDGEQFLLLHTSPGDARVKLGEVPDPSEIVEIVTAPGNARRVVAYARRHRERVYNPQTGSYDLAGVEEKLAHYLDWRVAAMIDRGPGAEGWDAELVRYARALPGLVPNVCIMHHRVPGIWRRGIPEIYSAYDWIRAQSKTLSALVTWTRAQAAIAWQIRQTITTAAGLQAAERAARALGNQTAGVAGVRVHNDQSEMTPVDVGTGQASNLAVTVRQTMLQGIRAFGFGEHFYGDASSGKYTTAANMEMPAIWTIELRQEMYRMLICNVLDYTVTHAQARRVLPADIDDYYDLDFPDAVPTDASTVQLKMSSLVQGVTAGLLDPREAAYQAYLAIGANDIDEILERQFGPPGSEPEEVAIEPEPEEPEEQEPDGDAGGAVAEAVAVRATVAARRRERLEREFAGAVQRRFIAPWHAQLSGWLRSQGETIPERGIMLTRLEAVRPDGSVLLGLLDDYMLRAANLGGQQAIDMLRGMRRREAVVREAPSETFVLRDPALRRALKQSGEKITGEVVQSMLDALAEVLTRAYYEDGLGPVAIADEIDTIFPATYANRAETIARTETAAAQMSTLNATYQRNGVEQKQWMSFLDDRTRDTHAAANGQTVPMDEPFVVGEALLMFPGDPESDHPEEVINCRCDMVPVVDGDVEITWLGGDGSE